MSTPKLPPRAPDGFSLYNQWAIGVEAVSIALQNQIDELKKRVELLEKTCVLLTDRCRELGCEANEALQIAMSRSSTLTLPEKRKSA